MTVLLKVKNLIWTPPGSDTRVLDQVDLSISAGELTTLRGGSGSGKSTLLRCIVGLEQADSGDILWHGERVAGDGFLRFRHRVRYVQQRPTRVADTIEDDLGFARDIAIERGGRGNFEARQRERLDRLGLGDIEWSRGFGDLSVGEQQRVALVRSLTAEPEILLLDEPTSALDPARVEDVEALVRDYLDEAPDERAVLWVTHLTEQVERLGGRQIDLDDLNGTGAPTDD
jgi:putative ABC transport system ATP-binding protein